MHIKKGALVPLHESYEHHPLAMVDDLLAMAPCNINSVAVNVFINTHIEIKKLESYTPDVNGKSKCHKIHIGNENPLCPDLKVYGTKMGKVNHDTYLGDIVIHDGSNKLNFRSRIGKGWAKYLIL